MNDNLIRNDSDAPRSTQHVCPKPVPPHPCSAGHPRFADLRRPLGCYWSGAAAPPFQADVRGWSCEEPPPCVTWRCVAGTAIFLLLLAPCLPAPCRCLSMDYTLLACLHAALQLQLCLLAEQASLSEKLCGPTGKTASLPIKSRL